MDFGGISSSEFLMLSSNSVVDTSNFKLDVSALGIPEHIIKGEGYPKPPELVEYTK